MLKNHKKWNDSIIIAQGNSTVFPFFNFYMFINQEILALYILNLRALTQQSSNSATGS